MKHTFLIQLTKLLVLSVVSLGMNAQTNHVFHEPLFRQMEWRSIGPQIGGRSVAVTGFKDQPMQYLAGYAGGGLWLTEDAGISWQNISDEFFFSSSIGAIEVAPSSSNIIYVGTGEHTIRANSSSAGDGIYKSIDGGHSWKNIGLFDSKHISSIEVHPENPDIVYVGVQGAAFGPSKDRGVYKSTDGGENWRKVLFVNATTGAAQLIMDPSNPAILYASMWDHERKPWHIRSGGLGSGMYKSIDAGESWVQLNDGLPEKMGKSAITISPQNPLLLYATIEAHEGGVYSSNDGGEKWTLVNNAENLQARAWYYTKIYSDPLDSNTVYILNDALWKSNNGGADFQTINTPHQDQHDLWLNPNNPGNLIIANDGGAAISFNGGKSWTSQQNQPTGQFYRVVTDNQNPFYLYGAQQDYGALAISNRPVNSMEIKPDIFRIAGGESGFIALDKDNPIEIIGGSYQGNLSQYNKIEQTFKDIMIYPELNLGERSKTQKYRFNWNAPVAIAPNNNNTYYHGAQFVLKSNNKGKNWKIISPDLTRNDTKKQGLGGGPYTNEAAGAENYNTISYIALSDKNDQEIWVGSDDGLLHCTKDGGQKWKDITPPGMPEAQITDIKLSPFSEGHAIFVADRHKFNEYKPYIYFTEDYGRNWKKITHGIDKDTYVKSIAYDPQTEGILYAGTENGMFITLNNGEKWYPFQLNLPRTPISAIEVNSVHNTMVISTMGRGFWVLDELSPIQQSVGQLLNNQPMLFSPQSSYELKDAIAGEQMVIDFFLPDTPIEGELIEISIKDENSNTVRVLSTRDEGIIANRGINRWFWDMRAQPLDVSKDKVYLNDYRGGLMKPGKYELTLSYRGNTYTQGCFINYTSNETKADWTKKQYYIHEIDVTVNDIYAASQSLEELYTQLKTLMSPLEKREDAQSLVNLGKEILLKADYLQAIMIQPMVRSKQDVIAYPNGLSYKLVSLREKIETPYPEISEGASQHWEDLNTEWKDVQRLLNKLLNKDIEQFNQLYKKKGIPILMVSSGISPTP